MRRFTLHIIAILLGMLLIMALLDLGYTRAYENSFPRSKFQLLRKCKDQKIDYIFLGSSRVENGIVPEVIEQKTGKRALNFGFTASKLNDIFAVLKLLKEYNIKSETVLIQIDYIFDIDGHSNTLPFQMAPFMRENQVTYDYFDTFISEPMFQVPFYRYCAYDHKIGVRELSMNVADKKTAVIATGGYSPVFENNVKDGYKLPKRIRLQNPVYDAMVKYCRENNINVIFFCAPFWKGNQSFAYIDKLKERIPALKDYSQLINDKTMFHNDPHLNDKGARFFTAKLCDDLLMGKQQASKN